MTQKWEFPVFNFSSQSCLFVYALDINYFLGGKWKLLNTIL